MVGALSEQFGGHGGYLEGWAECEGGGLAIYGVCGVYEWK